MSALRAGLIIILLGAVFLIVALAWSCRHWSPC